VRSKTLYLAALVVAVGLVFWAPPFSPPTEAAAGNGAADLARMGPYAIGHTNVMLYDTSRPGGRDGFPEFATTGRPIPVSIWYPVDPSTVAGKNSNAEYPLDVLYGIAPPSTSADWEAYGIDPAFEGPAPSKAKPFPLVIVSPGWGAWNWIHSSIGTRLASHGFVVAVPYHFGDQAWPWEPPYDSLAEASYNRPIDVSFALTDLLRRNSTRGDLFYGVMKPDQIAAAGWSLGGYASMVLAGGDDSVCDLIPNEDWALETPPWTCVPAKPDPRIKAIVPLDGSNQLLHFSELARVKVPAMGMGEEWDMLALDPPFVSWQARQHAAFSGKPAYRVDLYGSIHQTFSDFCEAGHLFIDLPVDPGFGDWILSTFCGPEYIASPLAHQLTNKYMLAFLKTHLAGERGYQDMLTPGWAVSKEQVIEFFVTEKRNPNSVDEDWPGLFVYFPHQSGSVQARGPKDGKTMPVARVGVVR